MPDLNGLFKVIALSGRSISGFLKYPA